MNLVRPLIASIAIALTVSAAAETSDAPAPDTTQILQLLKSLKEQQTQQIRASKLKVLQEAQTAAASPSAAASAWVEAVRMIQFVGNEKEFGAWKDGDGSTFSDPRVQRAAQLYFRWLALTMQHSNGTPSKDLLSQVVQFTKEIAADQADIASFGEHIQKEKDLAASKFHGNRKDNAKDDERVRKVHDQILRGGVQGAAPVKALHAEGLLTLEKWTASPSDTEGMFNAIILPELRAAKDTRIFEYWDMKIKKEGEAVKDKPEFDKEKYLKETYPSLLWSRAHEYAAIGQPNRALGEMFKVVKTYPQHPALSEWIKQIEGILTPPTPAASAGTSSAEQ